MNAKNIFGSLVFSLLLLQCGKDSGVEPTAKAKIEGTISFSGAWPEAAEEVRVVVGRDFPIVRFDDLIMVKLTSDAASVKYSAQVDYGEYKFIGVAWKPMSGEWGLASICGIYSMDDGFRTPAKVSLSNDQPIAGDIRISVDRSQARKLTGTRIVGQVTLNGAWPDSFSSAMLISSEKDLISEPFTLLDLNMGTAIERGETTMDYAISTPAGTNRTIGVAFLDKDGRLTQEAVYFAKNNGGMEMREQSITSNQTVTGPDFSMRLGSITSGIQGTVSFLGSWPAAAAEVRLITATVFPPAIEELIIGEEISPSATNHKYTFYLNPATYKVVGVVWRAEGTSWDLMSICGAYFAGDDSLAPSKVVVPNEETIVRDVNIVVRRSRARKITDTFIEGNILFNGTWPAGCTEARVIATTKFQIHPTILPTMLDLAFSDPIPAGTTAANYRMRAFPGTFAAMGVIFLKGDEQLTIADILYSLDVGGLNLEPFVVAENQVVAGRDFNIQF
ncbi:hypothetical protein JW998_11565 [candidate division KSB1 bacterium]|nr:hypothetical protein [candidate division KSB1 bacterium]